MGERDGSRLDIEQHEGEAGNVEGVGESPCDVKDVLSVEFGGRMSEGEVLQRYV